MASLKTEASLLVLPAGNDSCFQGNAEDSQADKVNRGRSLNYSVSTVNPNQEYLYLWGYKQFLDFACVAATSLR